MSSLSSSVIVERARPLLGNQVAIKVDGMTSKAADDAINAAFSAIETIHRLMSFHEAGSDITDLNRHAALHPVRVDPHTYHVMSRALDVAHVSNGVFDPSVAGQLVTWGFLPRPSEAPEPRAAASWMDVELLADNRIRYHQPLWIDVGGIAKGYAVDCAMDVLRRAGVGQARVNAGGDVGVLGLEAERIFLRTDYRKDFDIPVIELSEGSIAGSSGRPHRRSQGNVEVGPHLDGVGRCVVGVDTFAAVLAQDCMTADALTKVVLARENAAAPILRHFGAVAYLQSSGGVWHAIGRA
jgi:thiamine biosynthesis lipoprotein